MTNDKCKNVAMVRRSWPGREPDLVCIDHATDTQKIADVMGFYVLMEPLAYNLPGPLPDMFPLCSCSAGFSQKVEIKETQSEVKG